MKVFFFFGLWAILCAIAIEYRVADNALKNKKNVPYKLNNTLTVRHLFHLHSDRLVEKIFS